MLDKRITNGVKAELKELIDNAHSDEGKFSLYLYDKQPPLPEMITSAHRISLYWTEVAKRLERKL